MSMEPPQAYCCATTNIFSDTLSEMATNNSDIEQRIRTMSEKKTHARGHLRKLHSTIFFAMGKLRAECQRKKGHLRT